MPFLPSPKVKWFAIISLLAVGFFAYGQHAIAQDGTVQTYTNQAIPSDVPPQYDRYSSPVKAGQLTLEDVLAAHPKQKPALLPPVVGGTVTATSPTTPLLAPTSGASSQNIMLMQGMKTVLQQGDTNTPTRLKAPQMQGAGGVAGQPLSAAASVSTTPVNVSTAPGVVFEPGQAPKNLATGAVISTAAPKTTVSGVQSVAAPSYAPETVPAPMATTATAAATTTGAKTMNGCEEHTQSWTKTCAEAGYPSNFNGKITGETRTTCPEGSLQDVWIANSCAPPEEGASASYAPNPPATATTGLSNTAAEQQALTNAAAETTMPATAALPPPAPPAGSLAPSVVSQTMIPNVRTDANCGSANGMATNARPIADLCSAGEVSEVSGEGPWRWTCKGIQGGMTVSCAAPVSANAVIAPPSSSSSSSSAAIVSGVAASPTAEDGTCGTSDGAGTDHMPGANLCAHGVASRVSGNGPWTWACSGFNGGSAAACTAPKKADGACGSSTRVGSDQMPTNDLCSAGYASAVTGDGPWNWTCSGVYGGAAAMCSAAPKRDAVCGSASLTGHKEAPQGDLCSVGSATSVRGAGPWSWTCNGSNGGSSVTCNSSVSESGTCGAANGVAVARAPNDELCIRGTATRVTGAGPWQWNCAGSEGGDTESCTAPLISRQQQEENAKASAPTPAAPLPTPAVSVQPPAERAPAPISEATPSPAPRAAASMLAAPSAPAGDTGLCGDASELMALAAPEHDLCKTGHASSVGGNGPWTWTCADGSHTSNCSTLSPATSFSESVSKKAPVVEAAPAPEPAPAPAAMTEAAPERLPTPTSMIKPATEASVESHTATCGTASNTGSAQMPADDLCSIGKSSVVKGNGPWHWTCAQGKTKASCEAPKITDGACGIANGSVQKYAPVKGLCSSGTPTQIQGVGPWLWTCVGTGGGVSISCSATSQSQTRVDGSCGAAASSPAPATPDVNLCDSGVPSTVYGEGPWTWTCSGLNGGVATSCSAQKGSITAPPPPGPAVNGLCGGSNGVAAVVQPMDELCTAGAATSVSGNGPWNWNCIGNNGGMTVSCTAPLQPPAPITGVCGGANGVPTLTTPRSGLCSAGISSAVSGKGPWTWSCSGTNGGGAVGCVAPMAGSGGGAMPSMVSPSEAPVPMAAPSGRVSSSGLTTPKLPSGPLPPSRSSGTFPVAPTPSNAPMIPTLDESDAMAPASEPDLPAGSSPLNPPALADNMKTAPALKHDLSNSIPGNRFTLDDDVSSIPFSHASENINADVLPKLDKLAAILLDHSGARITLVAYADSSGNITPRDARRLSLTRALAVRDYLTAKGVSSGRIDVRALGANVPSGDPDRVDIKTN